MKGASSFKRGSFVVGINRRRGRIEESEMMQFWVLLVCIWSWTLAWANGFTDPADVSALNVLYGTMNLAPQLTGWTANGGDPCGQFWKGITCSGAAVTEIKLPGMQLSGALGFSLNTMISLIELDLSNNNLGGGGLIPYNLPPNLQRLSLSGNTFNGGIPYSISLMVSLKYLGLNHNQLQGNLDDIFMKLSNLTILDLSFNSFSGVLPESFRNLSSLTTLHLQNNQFMGTIDVLASIHLEDLSYGNSWSAGPAPPPPPYTPPPARRTHPGQISGGGNSLSDGVSSRKNSGFGGGVIAPIVIAIAILAIGAMMAFFLVKRRTRNTSGEEKKIDQDCTFTLPSKDGKQMIHNHSSALINTEILHSANPIILKPPPIERKKSFDNDDDLSNQSTIKKANAAPIRALAYSVADLQIATGSFSIENLIGEGSIGRVYRAQVNDGKVLAVKKINSSALPSQSSDEFLDVVSNISQLHHPNVTELVGYCSEHGQHLLIYEFYKNGSLHDVIHHLDEYSKPLSWAIRVKIALGTARALEYLHEVCSPSVLHKNVKSANVLLDGEHNPHLSDCGMSSIVPALEYQALDHSMASGYSAPEVAMSGQYTLKSDVYSFGVIMLELMTGRKPFDSSRQRLEQSLARWAAPQLHDIDALDRMVDPSLEGLYPAKALSRFADVIALCIQPEPEFRPPMSEVVQALVRLVQRSNMSKRTFSKERFDATGRYDDPLFP
ncbi:protein STRUBBELIG-RECEPTOR FAMILY 6-like isoform X2 [Phalaenopsis equestris]|uniref:protein STRUBBELIG-RECEPTOR FAMILY 6-like isoform X2 n=1 Tax=Phalaenopsis equestris TaxID=78828 RepID=UPI0009E35456|nr:protein STRUBBELIG-RECEPTOR FAMILY 6-like isoform X2 [Phalaenopsis equestris]